MAILSALLGRSGNNFEKAYPGTQDCTGSEMQKAIEEWFNLYYAKGNYKHEDPCQRIPCAVVSKLYKACFSEYDTNITVDDEKGKFYLRCLKNLDNKRKKAVQLAMIGGESWLKPIPLKDGFSFAVVRRDAVSVLERDGDGNVTDLISSEETKTDEGYYKLYERRTVDCQGRLTIQNRLFSAKRRMIQAFRSALQHWRNIRT